MKHASPGEGRRWFRRGGGSRKPEPPPVDVHAVLSRVGVRAPVAVEHEPEVAIDGAVGAASGVARDAAERDMAEQRWAEQERADAEQAAREAEVAAQAEAELAAREEAERLEAEESERLAAEEAQRLAAEEAERAAAEEAERLAAEEAERAAAEEAERIAAEEAERLTAEEAERAAAEEAERIAAEEAERAAAEQAARIEADRLETEHLARELRVEEENAAAEAAAALVAFEAPSAEPLPAPETPWWTRSQGAESPDDLTVAPEPLDEHDLVGEATAAPAGVEIDLTDAADVPHADAREAAAAPAQASDPAPWWQQIRSQDDEPDIPEIDLREEVAPLSDEPEDVLARLARLRDAGLLTPAEFEDERRAMLGTGRS